MIQVVQRTTNISNLVVRRKIHLSRANGQVEFPALIWAIYFDSVSTMDEPRHEHCDVDWCWWMQAMAAGVDPEQYWQETRHDRPLPLPAAERLSHPELLKRCSLLGTSNANKCLHSVVWRRAPKMVFTTRSTVEIAVALGAVKFNCGRGQLGCARLVN